MRIGILGTGAVGGLYGGMLARAGHDVHFLLHSDYDHVRANGLRVDSVFGNFHLPSPQVYPSVEAMPHCDAVIVTTKTTLNHRLDAWLPEVVSEAGIVLTLQNGLNVEADIGRRVPMNRVLGGCCFLCSNKVGPGHIHHLDYGRIVMGPSVGGDGPTAVHTDGRRLLEMMRSSGIDANWTEDLATARWRKLMWNIPFNGLSVVMDASTDQIIGCKYGRDLAAKIIAEVHNGAAACGVRIDADAIDATMRHTETMVPYDSSMRLDDRHGREMEVDAIFGNPLSAVASITGKPASQIMPRVEMLYQLLSHRNRRRQHRQGS
ncbi:MAG: putative 2-dehydropantoate 2-reductase [Planctomycetota bacterium]